MAELMDFGKLGRWVLRCHVCECAVPTSYHDFARRKGNWPRCCGEPMAVHFHDERASARAFEDSPDERLGA